VELWLLSESAGSRRNVKRFRGGLVVKAHRLVYLSTLGWGVIKKKKKQEIPAGESRHSEPSALNACEGENLY